MYYNERSANNEVKTTTYAYYYNIIYIRCLCSVQHVYITHGTRFLPGDKTVLFDV